MDFIRRNRRLVGFLILIIGVVSAAWEKHSYDTGDTIDANFLIIMPFLILYGLAATLHPQFLILRGEFGSASAFYKLAYVLMFVVGFGLGFYLRFVVFKAWH